MNESQHKWTNKQTNRQTNEQLNICCLQTLHELATGRSRGRLKLMSYLRLEISVSARFRWANIVFEESWLTTGMYCLMKWKIGLVGQFINPSTNKQTNKQIGTQKKRPRNLSNGTTSNLKENISTRVCTPLGYYYLQDFMILYFVLDIFEYRCIE